MIGMKIKIIVLYGCLTLILGLDLFAQNNRVWNNRKYAICLTYDDGLDIDLDNVIPVLDSLGLKATFYVPGSSQSLARRLGEWRAAAKEGHELGNHTSFHPCEGQRTGREWVSPDYDLLKYSMQRIVDEIRLSNTLLKAIDGKTKRTFAYTCGDEKIGDSSFMDRLKGDFIAARGVTGEMLKINEINIYRIGSYMIMDNSGDELIDMVKKNMENNTLLVFLFHGVGGGHNINVSLAAHRQLLYFLKQNEKDIWTAPLIEISEYILNKGH
jgi:sialate O-acetylesterase